MVYDDLKPGEMIAVDTACNLPKTTRGNCYLMIVACCNSGYVCAYPMTNNKSPSTAKVIKTHFMATMPPRLLQTDGGSEYQSHFMAMLATYGVKHHLTVPHIPQSIGVAEAAVRLVKEGILRLITRAGESRKNWDELVGIVCVSINNSVMAVPWTETLSSDAPVICGRGQR